MLPGFDYKYNVSGFAGTTSGGTLPTPEEVLAVLQAAVAQYHWTVTK